MLLLVVGPNKVSEYYRPHLKQQIRYVIKLSNNSWQHLDFRTRSEDTPVRTFTLTSEEFLETALQHQPLHFHPTRRFFLPPPPLFPLPAPWLHEKGRSQSQKLSYCIAVLTPDRKQTCIQDLDTLIWFKGRNFTNRAMLMFRKKQSLSTISETASN